MSRRRLLAALGGVGGLGVLGGAGTRAALHDSARIPVSILGSPYRGEELRVEARCRGPACTVEDDRVTFAFTDIDPPASGSTTLCLHVQGSPAWLWLRTSGPVSSQLGSALTLSLTYGDDSAVEVSGNEVTGWSLNPVLDAFDDGRRLTGTGPGGAVPAGRQRCLTIEWELPDTPDVAGEDVEFDLTFAAIQYRPDTTPTNPWTNRT